MPDAPQWERHEPPVTTTSQKSYIDGPPADSRRGRTFTTIDPARGELLAEVEVAGTEEVERGVEAPSGGLANWSRMRGASAAAFSRAWRKSCAHATASLPSWKHAIPASRSKRRRLSTSNRGQTVSSTTLVWHSPWWEITSI